MICGLTSGRAKQCKDSIAGFDVVYLFPFVKYSRSQIILDDNKVTTFPATTIFKFEVLSPTLTEDPNEDGGGKFYSQSLSFNLAKFDIIDNLELVKLIKKDYRAIVLDRNGNNRIVGLYNGLIAELAKVTGSGKGDFNGYKITMEGQEALSAFFIDDLSDAGFTISEDNFLLLEDGSFLLLEDNERIILE
jgi:hypothetical protein